MPVYQKKDGRYAVVYYAAGRRLWEYFGRGKQGQELALRRDLELRLQKLTQAGGFSTGYSMTFLELAQAYLNHRGQDLADSTLDGILRCLRTYYLPVIGRTPIAQLRLSHWRVMEERMVQAGLKNRTINTYFKYGSRIFAWALDQNEDLLQDHPLRKRRALRERDNHRVVLMTPGEFRAILAAAEPHLRWCLEVAYYTGVRPGPSELFALRWDDVNWQAGTLRVYRPKTGTSSVLHLDPGFLERMGKRFERQRREYPGSPYICHYRGRPIGSNINHAWRSAKEKAGISRPVRLYDIRHLHISHALANGADMVRLASAVGHQNPRMIAEVYAHLAEGLRAGESFRLAPGLFGAQEAGGAEAGEEGLLGGQGRPGAGAAARVCRLPRPGPAGRKN